MVDGSRLVRAGNRGYLIKMCRVRVNYGYPKSKRFQKHVALKMENLANLEKSMKNSSAPTAPTQVAADISSAGQSTDDPNIAHGGAARAHEDEGASFTTVTRSKAGRTPPTQKEAVPGMALPPPKTCTFKDPFGLTRVDGRTMNPVTVSTGSPLFAFILPLVMALWQNKLTTISIHKI